MGRLRLKQVGARARHGRFELINQAVRVSEGEWREQKEKGAMIPTGFAYRIGAKGVMAAITMSSGRTISFEAENLVGIAVGLIRASEKFVNSSDEQQMKDLQSIHGILMEMKRRPISKEVKAFLEDLERE